MVKATNRPLYPRENDPVFTVQEARWAPGPLWTGAESLDPNEVRFLDRLAHSESLYRLCYSDGCFILHSSTDCHEKIKIKTAGFQVETNFTIYE